MHVPHGREREPADVRQERVEAAARDVLEAAARTNWFDADVLDALTESPVLQQAIATLLAAYGLKVGPSIWDRAPARLRRAWDAYLQLDFDAVVVDQLAQDTAVSDFVADLQTTSTELARVLATRGGHGAGCRYEPYDVDSCTCWRSVARARLATMRGAA